MGWIFFKPVYERVKLVDCEDLDRDPVPVALGSLWRDPVGAFVYGGLVTKLAVWHCTFLVNSLAHWDGLQPYSAEDTSRGNLVLAILTGEEGNHNFIIAALHFLGLIKSIRRARPQDIHEARFYMHPGQKPRHVITDSDSNGECIDIKQFGQPGGATLLRDYSRIGIDDNGKERWRDSSWAFGGGLNNHGRAAKRRMRELRVARISDKSLFCSQILV
ncbi:hypothetical protein BDR05DRAFT_972225 [Suillus weaverae]|nr:hypothetical protein BDR05DRAFT_972225 [Suillus weaverae]